MSNIDKKPVSSNWGQIAHRSSEAEHSNEIKALKLALQAERKAHEQTAKALKSARSSSESVVVAPRPKKTLASKGDIVEVIFSDVHGNKHDPLAFSALLGDLKTIRPDRIIIGGDLLDCSGFLAEHHTLGYLAETEDSYEDDVKVTNILLDQIQKHSSCEDIHYIEGNHEWRVERWAVNQKLAHHKDVELLRNTFCAEHVLGLKERGIQYYRQGMTHGDCITPGWVKFDKVSFVHKISNATDAAEVALSKAAGNIVFFDSHRATFKPKFLPNVGLIAAWNPGCLCKRQPHYANTNPTTWTHGYLVRVISRSTGNFQMMNVTINNGESFAGLLLKNREEQ